MKFSLEGVVFDGSKIALAYTANYDGKDVPFTGSENTKSAIVDTTSIKRINATTTEEIRKKGNKVVMTITAVFSADGKLCTATIKGINAQGQAWEDVEVYEKQ